jgi:hypothetical protein
MDLIRKLLLAYEEADPTDEEYIPDIEGYDVKMVDYHIKLMLDAGFLEKIFGPSYLLPEQRYCCRLNWAGHDFLEASRDENRWKEAKTIVGKVGVFTIDVLKQVLSQLIQTQLKQVMG